MRKGRKRRNAKPQREYRGNAEEVAMPLAILKLLAVQVNARISLTL
jgi:hypothetical protein